MVRRNSFLLLFLFKFLCHTKLIVLSSSLIIPSSETVNVNVNRRSLLKAPVIAVPLLSSIFSPAIANANAINAANAANANVIQTKPSIANRLNTDTLTIPPTSQGSELNPNGVDNTYYPPWLEGEWKTTQTLIHTSTPLGFKYIGGPNGSESIAQESYNEQLKQLNIPISFRLRYVKTNFGIAEDRIFNTKERLNAFAGRNVVSSVEYADVGASNRSSVLLLGGGKDDPLQTTVTRFKGPAAQKTFLIGHGQDSISNSRDGGEEDTRNTFSAYELLRNIFALTNTNTAPPITTDTELIFSFKNLDDDEEGRRVVDARLRIASYLNAQSDKLYFEAKNRAVSLADYELKLRKVI